MSNRKMIAFGLALALAAAPLFWLNLDPAAGEKLLRWTSRQPAPALQAR